MVSVNMLDTGFDCPEVVNLVMARFTKCAILYQQMRGRGTRKAPHIKKTGFTMFDFVGVTDFHGDDDEDREGGFVIRVAKPQTTDEAAPAADPRRRRSHRPGDARMAHPRRQRRHRLFGRARGPRQRLGLRFEAWLADTDTSTPISCAGLRMMESKIKADADDADAFGAGGSTIRRSRTTAATCAAAPVCSAGEDG